MKNFNFKKNSLLVMIFISFFAFTSDTTACTSDTSEPNNNVNQADYVGDLRAGTAYTLNTLCLTAGDNDYFSFYANGQEYYVKVRGYSATTNGRYKLWYTRSGNTLTIETHSHYGSTTDTYLHLYNSDGTTQLASNDDGGADYFSKIVYTIPTCTDSSEPNNTASQASYLGSGTSYTKNNLCLFASDNDYFSFYANGQEYYVKVRGYSTTTNGRYKLRYTRSGNTLTIETQPYNGSTTDTYLELYNSNVSILLASNDDGGTGYFSKIIYTIPTCTDSLEPNNVFSHASYLGPGAFPKDNLCLTGGDNDYFRFSVGSTSYYIKVRGYSSSTTGRYTLDYTRSGNTLTIETQPYNGSTTDTYLELYSADGTTLLTSNDDGGTGRFSKIIYTIFICTDSLEFDNTANYATNIGYATHGSVWNVCLTPGDNDYFRFSVNGQQYYINVRGYSTSSVGKYNFDYTRSGNTVTIETQPYNGSTTDTYLELYSSNGTTLLTSNDDGGTGYFSKIIYTVPSALTTPNTDNNPSPSTSEAKVQTYDIQQTGNISITPNPVRVGRTSKVNIETEVMISSAEVVITDISGRTLSRKTVEVNEKGIEIPPFDNSGIYIISVHAENFVNAMRLVVTE